LSEQRLHHITDPSRQTSEGDRRTVSLSESRDIEGCKLDPLVDRSLQYVPLPTVAALVYLGVTGSHLDATNAIRMSRILDDIAHALANLIPLYFMQEGMPAVVPDYELLGAKFDRGAHRLITVSGKRFHALFVQRRDIKAAIQILRAARVKFS
jgi:hypothetical protein